MKEVEMSRQFVEENAKIAGTILLQIACLIFGVAAMSSAWIWGFPALFSTMPDSFRRYGGLFVCAFFIVNMACSFVVMMSNKRLVFAMCPFLSMKAKLGWASFSGIIMLLIMLYFPYTISLNILGE
jgi:hypothetical protein